ncbi:unnamed protein product, partial [marine sediment metagenome]
FKEIFKTFFRVDDLIHVRLCQVAESPMTVCVYVAFYNLVYHKLTYYSGKVTATDFNTPDFLQSPENIFIGVVVGNRY